MTSDGRGVLLVVEDHEATVRVLQRLLTQRGWRVQTAGTVAEGLQRLDSPPEPDWIFLDLMLPDGRGESVLSEVRDRNLRTRVIVMTATHDPARLADVQRLRPDALVQKPIDLDAICGMCETASAD
jgi:two-component system response regulator RegA